MGLIYRMSQAIRFGAAVHTPTAYGLDDSFSTSMDNDFTLETGENYNFEADSPDGYFEYTLTTPWRFIGSTGILFGKAGFVSAELEWVDYSTASFNFKNENSDDKSYERELNTEIDRQLQSNINLRVGGEMAYKIFRFRAGVGLQGSPIEGDDTFQNSYSLGLGVREKSFYLDLGYQLESSVTDYLPYVAPSDLFQPTVENDSRKNKYILTLGYRF